MAEAGAATRGAAWTSAASILSQGMSFLVFVVLARLTQPEDYGLIAISMALILILAATSSLGLYKLLIQLEHCGPAQTDTAFYLSLLLGLLLALSLWLTAPWLAQLTDTPGLTAVMRALSPVVIFKALEVVPLGLMVRDFRFKAIALRSIMAIVAGGIAAISVALQGHGVWALVVQEAVKSSFSLVALWFACRWLPGNSASVSAATDLLGKSLHFMGTDLTKIAQHHLDRLLIGTYLGIVSLGIYTIAAKVNRIANSVLQDPLRTVGLPVFAHSRSDNAALQQAYLRSQRLGTAIVLPVFVVLLLTADWVIPLLLGGQWQASAPVVQALCLASCALSVGLFNAPLLQAVGRADLALRINLLSVCSGVLLFFVVKNWGLLAISLALALRNWLILPLEFRMCRRHAGILTSSLWGPLTRLIITLVPMILVVTAIRASAPGAASWPLLLSTLGAALITYLLTMGLTDRPLLGQLLAIPGVLAGRER